MFVSIVRFRLQNNNTCSRSYDIVHSLQNESESY